jgi:hypothetical protein
VPLHNPFHPFACTTFRDIASIVDACALYKTGFNDVLVEMMSPRTGRASTQEALPVAFASSRGRLKIL